MFFGGSQVDKTKKYNIGLDIGTESVGWAVTDPDTFKVLRVGKNKLWGVRLFEEGQTAEVRRNFRSNRRRYDRRRQRILYLQELFGKEMEKIDNSFFVRLKDGFLNIDDKTINKGKISKKFKYNLFIDENFNDSHFYKKYPTIYHLRYELMYKPVDDLRLIYLAMHHIIKYRGNFLKEGKKIDVNNIDIVGKLEEIFKEIEQNCDDIFTYEYNVNCEKIKDILIDKNSRKIEKQKLIVDELGSFIEDKDSCKNIAALMVGLKSNLLDIFCCVAEDSEQLNKCKISFDGTDFEDNLGELEEILDKNIELINLFKELYDDIYLNNLFKDSKEATISYVMIERFNKHKEDKRLLKSFLDDEDKKKIFGRNGIYNKYVKQSRECNYELFTKELRKILNKYTECDIKTRILFDLDSSNFLPKITDTSNGRYPYQLNLNELNKIIETQGEKFPFLKQRLGDENCYKIEKLLTFRIPYYVGPLNRNINRKDSKAWIIKNNDEKITPYNFEKVVNRIESANQFIKRMTSNCTYLYEEKAMPANSLLYSKFKVLNELKQIRINGKKIDKDLEYRLLNDLFLRCSKVTDKLLKKYLIEIKYPCASDLIDITGYSNELGFANNLKPYIDFMKIFDLEYIYNNEEVIENMIEWITIFEDKKILKQKINIEYPLFDECIVNKICNLNYKGWSALSRRLLTDVYYVDKVTKEKSNIIELMEETNANFMQILFDKRYKFQNKINKLNFSDDINKITIEDIQNLSTSPANKRGIWQAIKIVNEIVEIIGFPPQHIYIEMAKGNSVKKRTDSRNNKLLNLYNKCSTDIDRFNELYSNLQNCDKLDKDKYFLYYLQQGKCLYTGKELSLGDLDKCEIDHIIPRSLIKDDSLDNRALVLRQENQNKGNLSILPDRVRNSYVIGFWKQLKDNKFISEKKYNNLMRSEFREIDIEGFINRQLVETRQITKHVAALLNDLYDSDKNVGSEDTVVQFINANISHNYRDKYELYKFRQLNNFHHAHDAYLVAVLGSYKTKLFNNVDIKEFIYTYKDKNNNSDSNNKCYGLIIDSIEKNIYNSNGEIVFAANNFKEIVCNNLYNQDILVTRKVEFKTGEFYNQTIYKKGKGKISLKKGLDPNKYGGYNSVVCSYLMFIKYVEKGTEKRKLVGIPIMYTVGNNSSEQIDRYIKETLKVNSYEILKDKIPFNSLIKYNGNYCFIKGYTGGYVELCNAQELKLSKKEQIEYKKLLYYIFNNISDDDNKVMFANQIDDFFNIIISKIRDNYPLYNNELNLLVKLRDSSSYMDLTFEDKKNLIIELINMLATNSTNAKLEFLKTKTGIGFVNSFGKKNGLSIKNFVLCTQSVTGIKESDLYYGI